MSLCRDLGNDANEWTDRRRDIVSVLAEADADDRAEVYQQLGVELVCHPDGRVAVEALPRGLNVRVGGPSWTRPTRTAPLRRWVPTLRVP
jgi:hypothetical protein